MENATILKEADTTNAAGQQKMTTETQSISNLTAGLLQKSLSSTLSSRTELLNSAAAALHPKLPEMLVQSGNDPDKFTSAVRQHVESPTFLKGLSDKSTFSESVQTTTWAVLGSMNGADIEAIAFLVLMAASKSAQEDLKGIMASVKSINDSKSGSKEKLRDLMEIASREHSHKLKDDDD